MTQTFTLFNPIYYFRTKKFQSRSFCVINLESCQTIYFQPDKIKFFAISTPKILAPEINIEATDCFLTA